MDKIKQAFVTLRTDTEKNITRAGEADRLGTILQIKLRDKEEEITSLQEKLSLTRRYITLAGDVFAMKQKLRELGESISSADSKAELVGRKLEHIEREKEVLETRHLEIRAKHRALQAQLDDLF